MNLTAQYQEENLKEVEQIFNIPIPKGTKFINKNEQTYELERPDGLKVFIKLADPRLLNSIRLTHPDAGFVIKAVGFVRGIQIMLNYAKFYGKDIPGVKAPYPADVNLN